MQGKIYGFLHDDGTESIFIEFTDGSCLGYIGILDNMEDAVKSYMMDEEPRAIFIPDNPEYYLRLFRYRPEYDEVYYERTERLAERMKL